MPLVGTLESFGVEIEITPLILDLGIFALGCSLPLYGYDNFSIFGFDTLVDTPFGKPLL